MLFKYSYFFFFIFLISCSDDTNNNENTKATEKITASTNDVSDVHYRLIEKNETIKDDASPIGEWEISISYPEIYGAINDSVKSKVNDYISNVASRYKCLDKGEYSFISKVESLNDRLLSVKYEAVWFCGISYQSTSNAVIFDLANGGMISLDSEFINDEQRSRLYLKITNKIKQEMSSEKNKECPVVDGFNYFYKNTHSLVFVVQMKQHLYTSCNIEIKIPFNELKQYFKLSSLLLE